MNFWIISRLNAYRNAKAKSLTTQGDLHNVTLGNPAIFQKQDTLKEAQQANIKTRSFPH